MFPSGIRTQKQANPIQKLEEKTKKGFFTINIMKPESDSFHPVLDCRRLRATKYDRNFEIWGCFERRRISMMFFSNYHCLLLIFLESTYQTYTVQYNFQPQTKWIWEVGIEFLQDLLLQSFQITATKILYHIKFWLQLYR